MKQHLMMAFTIVGLSTGITLNAEETQLDTPATAKPQLVAPTAIQKTPLSAAMTLSPEEQAFSAKLTDQNRKAFIEKLSVEQRKAAMAAAQTITADEAVAKLANSVVAVVE